MSQPGTRWEKAEGKPTVRNRSEGSYTRLRLRRAGTLARAGRNLREGSWAEGRAPDKCDPDMPPVGTEGTWCRGQLGGGRSCLPGEGAVPGYVQMDYGNDWSDRWGPPGLGKVVRTASPPTRTPEPAKLNPQQVHPISSVRTSTQNLGLTTLRHLPLMWKFNKHWLVPPHLLPS